MAATDGGVVIGLLVPHAPVLVPEVGGAAAREVAATVSAFREAARRAAAAPADALALTTPHGPVRERASAVYAGPELSGDFGDFGAPQAGVTVAVDGELAAALAAEAERAGLPCYLVGRERLDHGALVPLAFLAEAGALRPAVVFTPPWRLPLAHRLGRCLARAARSTGRRVALVASGDLSHRLRPGAPAGFSAAGREFDRRLVALLEAGAAEDALELPPDLVEEAAEDVLPSLAVLLGAVGERETEVELLSYEGPFGVGYAVAAWRVGAPRRVPGPVRAARRALELHYREGLDDPAEIARRLARELPPAPGAGDEEDAGAGAPAGPGGGEADLTGPARGVFVSLKKDGELRGCVGTILPSRPTLLEEIAAVALSSAEGDPRFPPVRREELDDLEISVDVLEPPQPVRGPEDLDPLRYGVIVEKGRRRGLLLPALPSIATPERQYALACRKAGVDPGEPGITVYRFRTRRYR